MDTEQKNHLINENQEYMDNQASVRRDRLQSVESLKQNAEII